MNEIANGFYEDRRIINPEATLGLVPSGHRLRPDQEPEHPRRASAAPSRSSPTPRPCAWTWAGSATGRTRASRTTASSSTSPISASAARSSARSPSAGSSARPRPTSAAWSRRWSATGTSASASASTAQNLPDGEYLIGAVANGRIFGKGMKVAPDARLDDGLFDAVLVRGFRFLEFCRHGWKLMNGSHVTHPKVSVVRGRRIEAWPERRRGRPARARRRSARPAARDVRDRPPQPARQGLPAGPAEPGRSLFLRPLPGRSPGSSCPLASLTM
ncbi:MAG: hypothetical protein M0C28_04810 [Candidatus Moduliflexus flocculans]|nr:hypothetical protein [Candidatus Moduliflexus flocculans]